MTAKSLFLFPYDLTVDIHSNFVPGEYRQHFHLSYFQIGNGLRDFRVVRKREVIFLMTFYGFGGRSLKISRLYRF